MKGRERRFAIVVAELESSDNEHAQHEMRDDDGDIFITPRFAGRYPIRKNSLPILDTSMNHSLFARTVVTTGRFYLFTCLLLNISRPRCGAPVCGRLINEGTCR